MVNAFSRVALIDGRDVRAPGISIVVVLGVAILSSCGANHVLGVRTLEDGQREAAASFDAAVRGVG